MRQVHTNTRTHTHREMRVSRVNVTVVPSSSAQTAETAQIRTFKKRENCSDACQALAGTHTTPAQAGTRRSRRAKQACTWSAHTKQTHTYTHTRTALARCVGGGEGGRWKGECAVDTVGVVDTHKKDEHCRGTTSGRCGPTAVQERHEAGREGASEEEPACERGRTTAVPSRRARRSTWRSSAVTSFAPPPHPQDSPSARGRAVRRRAEACAHMHTHTRTHSRTAARSPSVPAARPRALLACLSSESRFPYPRAHAHTRLRPTGGALRRRGQCGAAHNAKVVETHRHSGVTRDH